MDKEAYAQLLLYISTLTLIHRKAIIFDIKENDAFGKEKLISLEAILENFDISYAIQVIPLGLKGKSERDKIKKIAGSRKFTYPVVQYNDLFVRIISPALILLIFLSLIFRFLMFLNWNIS